MAERDQTRVLIVGCRQVGSRHLQAVATLPHVAEIDVIDPRAAATLTRHTESVFGYEGGTG
ncbi:MAG: hypothetical protein HYY59_07365 [Candidatus Omnitrophica bacterium]|nr:hypothetical protein [Candidatus Omnitrophota bacterium]